MCGIAGYYNFNNTSIKSNKEIVNMLNVQRHRGPDDSGIVFFNLKERTNLEVSHRQETAIVDPFEGVLGFNRLSILDLSYHGHQPMLNGEKNVMLTLNGEIYNAFDFKPELIKDGFHFKSTSDTEVVLYLYLKYGFEKMLSLLNGMFAIVIVDLRSSEVFIARDRFGIKPMYYFQENGSIGFTSEIKSFYQLNNFKATFNKDVLDEFLIYRNTRNETLINEVKILPPGHFMHFGKEGSILIKQYFDINSYQRKAINDKLEILKDNVQNSLEKSVNSQLISDVKLGCQLSGGVDSSVVTYLANKRDKTFESVSIIFDNPRFSEEKYIDQVADQLGIKSHKFTLTAEYYLNHLKKATWHLESPINHPNTIGIYLLSQQAKQHVTVLLSGEGADEVFGGYNRYHQMTHRYGPRFFKDFIKSFPHSRMFLKEYKDIAWQAVNGTAFMTFDYARELKPDFETKNATKRRLKIYNNLSGSIFDKQVKYEMSTYLPDLLIRQDKMSMAHSIENRVPFLDNHVVEKSFTYPEKMMIKKEKNKEKFLLKELGADFFGREFAYRDKMGFGIPLRDFFKNDTFKDYLVHQLLPSLQKRDIFDNRHIKELFEQVDTLSVHQMEALWILITLEIWLQEFIDNNQEGIN